MLNTNLKTLSGKLILLMVLFGVVSCTTPLREITYMHGIEAQRVYPDGPVPDTYRIRPNDLLYITVIGDDPANTAFLNLVQTQGNISGQSLELVTYVVDEEGKIWFPQFGEVDVAGFTVTEIRDGLQKMVDQYMEHASVFVKNVGRSLTVLGEVHSPGQHVMNKNKLSIFEALGLAGDINDFGNRSNVQLIRETPAGKQVAELNLTDPELIHSPYYYVLPHDVIYVKPSSKLYGRKTMPFGTGFSLVFSTISTTLLLINFFK